MSRYRKIQVRTWGDEKFRALSPIPPCGQGLWFYLLTGPHTGPIPGLFRAGRAGMAEDLGWPPEAFDKAFAEAFRQGMIKADFQARLMWVPNALKHNKPESPNVVTSWGTEFDLLPECALKAEAYESLKSFIIKMGEAYEKAFEKAFREPSSKASSKTMPNQEQEQEQEQKEDAPPLRDGIFDEALPSATATVVSTPQADLFRRGKEILGPSGGGLIRKLLTAKGSNVAHARAALEMASQAEYPREYLGAIIAGRDRDVGQLSARDRGDAW